MMHWGECYFWCLFPPIICKDNIFCVYKQFPMTVKTLISYVTWLAYKWQKKGRPSHIHDSLCLFVQSIMRPGNCYTAYLLQWHHNERDGGSNHQPHNCIFNCLFSRRSKKTPRLRVTGLCVGNSPMTGEFPAQMASNEDNVSIWWRHHVLCKFCLISQNNGWSGHFFIFTEILTKFITHDSIGDKWVVQVTSWCHQARSHYLNQWQSRSKMTYL